MINNKKLHSLYGLRWNPFLANVPIESLYKKNLFNNIFWKIEQLVLEGGFATITGEPGTGKSVLMRQLEDSLSKINGLHVRIISRPQSGIRDFYREISYLFGVDISFSYRFSNYQKIRDEWVKHFQNNSLRPVLLIDEAQEMPDEVFSEIRMMSSYKLDSETLVAAVMAGDSRLPKKLKHPDLLPLESRIRCKVKLEPQSESELVEFLKFILKEADGSHLFSDELCRLLAQQSMGNIRSLVSICNEFISYCAQNDIRKIDENNFYDLFKSKKPPSKK